MATGNQSSPWMKSAATGQPSPLISVELARHPMPLGLSEPMRPVVDFNSDQIRQSISLASSAERSSVENAATRLTLPVVLEVDGNEPFLLLPSISDSGEQSWRWSWLLSQHCCAHAFI